MRWVPHRGGQHTINDHERRVDRLEKKDPPSQLAWAQYWNAGGETPVGGHAGYPNFSATGGVPFTLQYHQIATVYDDVFDLTDSTGYGGDASLAYCPLIVKGGLYQVLARCQPTLTTVGGTMRVTQTFPDGGSGDGRSHLPMSWGDPPYGNALFSGMVTTMMYTDLPDVVVVEDDVPIEMMPICLGVQYNPTEDQAIYAGNYTCLVVRLGDVDDYFDVISRYVP